MPVVVRANLSWDEMARIEVAMPELPGVSIEQGVTRHYPFGETAAHVVGYVAAVSEQELDRRSAARVAGFPHRQERRREVAGPRAARHRRHQPGRGQRLWPGRARARARRGQARPGRRLSLDMALQDFVTQRCSAEQSVSCVLLDAVTGDVLALVSSPSFDPAPFSTGLTPAMWQELSNDPRKPLSNKAIAGVYPPGSTFKPVVAVAALKPAC